MKDIIEYAENFGERDFDAKAFNYVDSLILSQFSYLKLDRLVPCVGTCRESVAISDLKDMPDSEDMFSDERYAKSFRKFYDVLAKSRRFGDIRLNHYINLINRKWEMQFSAVTCYLPDGSVHVVYRGTDETLIGWKEDFNMAYITPIPAQVKAVDYLNYVAERIRGDFSVEGHSKGGNLAVYAAMKCPKATCDRIVAIYSHDGPGFPEAALSEDDFMRVKSRIVKLVPRSSIIGMLLQSQEEYQVIASKSFGILQHDPFNWIVDGDDFIYLPEIAEHCKIKNATINEWAAGTDATDLRKFVDIIFDVFTKAGITDLNELGGNPIELMKKFYAATDGLDEKHKEFVKEVLRGLLEVFKDQLISQSGISLISEWDRISKRNT